MISDRATQLKHYCLTQIDNGVIHELMIMDLQYVIEEIRRLAVQRTCQLVIDSEKNNRKGKK